jgi:apolipoprotein N-acyltransferase
MSRVPPRQRFVSGIVSVVHEAGQAAIRCRPMNDRPVRALWLALLGGTLLLAPDEPRLLALTGFCGLVLLSEALEHAPSPRRAALCGLVFGTAANVVALSSLVGLLGSFAHLAWPLALLLSVLAWLLQGSSYALSCGFAVLLERRGGPRFLVLPACLTVSSALVPLLFPWHIAATQVGFLPFVQLADLGGESLLGFVLALAACATQGLWRGPRPRLALVLLVSLALPLGYGWLRLGQVRASRERADTLSVGVVQSNVSMAQKHDEASARDNLRGLLALTHELEAQGAQLTVWAETAYPYALLRSETHAPRDVRAVLSDQVQGPILLGLETYLGFDDDAQKYNSAWLVRRDGSFGERVDKSRLLAFGEYIPFWRLLPPIRSRYASKGFSRGVPGIVRVDGHRLGVSICYEDLFASAARATVQLGGRALINLTNDAWFGDTREPLLHDTLARLRSVELRRDQVRAVNTGVSSWTSASGEVLRQTGTFRRVGFVAPVRLLDELTLYARLGDWWTPCCLLGLGVLVLRARRARRALTPC